jgi:hypothetical protein
MITEGTNDFSPTYSAWVGKHVVLLMVIRQCQVPVPCKIISETVSGVRLRIQPGLEIEVRKNQILAVEEAIGAPDGLVN